LLIAGGVFAGVKLSQKRDPAPTASPSPTSVAPTATPNTGPFTGIFRANYGPITGLNDVPGPDTTKPTDTYAVAPRVVSPAEALRGRYHQSRMFPAVGQRQQTDYAVRTACLRTGDRCISFFHGQAGEVEPLSFADGRWNLFTESGSTCRGGRMHVTKSGEYPLPQPLQNPITLLTGHGRQDQTAPCAANIEFDETFTRTGD
jgi:hypothetical protein